MSNILHSQDAPRERGDVLAHVAGNLRRLRVEAGMSQQALADRSGISRRMIVGVERGDANISLSSLDRLAAALGSRFADLVRDPRNPSPADIRALTWRGQHPQSAAVLLGSAPAREEAQLWIWTLGPGERYDAEPDPAGWHEMVYVIEGELTLSLSGEVTRLGAGAHAIYRTDQAYSYVNEADRPLKFLRNVVS